MTIIGVSMFRDEGDIAAQTIEHMLAQGVDRLIIADNLSTDGTREILESFPEVTVVEDNDPAYYQSAKMSRLARLAYDEGAEWVVPFDADEFWYWQVGTLAEFFSYTPWDVIHALTYEQIGDQRTNAVKRLPKVAFRAAPDAQVAQGNHAVAFTETDWNQMTGDGLLIREYQYRSLEQFKRKVRNGKAAYDSTNLPETEGAHWRTFGAMTDEELGVQWAQMLSRSDLIYDPFQSSSRHLGVTTA